MSDMAKDRRRTERWAQKIFFGLAGVAILLFTVLTISYLSARKNTITDTGSENMGKSPGSSTDAASPAFPLSPAHPNVSSVLIHYFLTGTIKSVKQTNGIPEIVMDTGVSPSLPPIMVTKEVRVSKISPPYSSATTQPKTANDLQPGLHVDISTEYDVRTKTWIVRDVFIPTDKNL